MSLITDIKLISLGQEPEKQEPVSDEPAKSEQPRQKCEVYSRVVGFLTPVSQWNKGKKEEFKDRKEYKNND